MNIALWLERAGKLWPQAPALFTGETVEADYAALAARAQALAAHLRARGVGPGDRVALFMANRTAYLVAMNAVWWSGAAVAPINAKLHAKEAAWILQNAEAALCFTDDAHGAALSAETATPLLSVDRSDFARLGADSRPFDPAPRAPDDLAWLFYTSGTTGAPKGVMMSHANLISMSLCYAMDVEQPQQSDAAFYAAPMSHGAGIYTMFHTRVGARHVCPASGGFDAAEIFELAPKLRNLTMFAAPTMVRRMTAAAATAGYKGEGIKTIVYGGGPMYLADLDAAQAQLGPRFAQIYGQGECPMGITALSKAQHVDDGHPRFRDRLASVGVAQSAVVVRITGESGALLRAGEIGEIEVSGRTVMLGYWRNPDATADTLRAGWLRTGDMGSLDADGFLTLHDRSKDMIISGGTNIYPREVEEALLTHADVAEAAVVGQPDLEWGELVIAFIALEPGAAPDPAALDAHCLANIARFKRPKRYEFLEALPKNNYGKILKTALRERLKTAT